MDSCKQAQKMISSAKVFMLMKLPFFGVLVSKLKISLMMRLIR